MTRDEIEYAYQIKDGVIISPGKFFLCPVYLPYYWEEAEKERAATIKSGNKKGPVSNNAINFVFEISDEDKKIFPEIPRGAISIVLWEIVETQIKAKLLKDVSLETTEDLDDL